MIHALALACVVDTADCVWAADQCPDGPRYKALGNSWAVNCAEWIGERIEHVEAILKAEAAA